MVVSTTEGGVYQRVVGPVDLGELTGRVGMRVRVGVKLLNQPAIGALDLLGSG